MVSPRKARLKTANEASNISNRLEKCRFYLDIKNYIVAKKLESRIKKLGGCVEVFLCASVTHVITDGPPGRCAGLAAPPAEPPAVANHQSPSTSLTYKFGEQIPRGVSKGLTGGRRADAMLERVHGATHDRSDPRPALKVPVWTIEKALWFLDKVYASFQKSVKPTVKILNGAFIKFEPFDRTTRPVFKEFTEWPQIDLSVKEIDCSYMPHRGRKVTKLGKNKSSSSGTSQDSRPTHLANKGKQIGDLSSTNRMTRKTKQRREKNNTQAAKQSSYCEICRVDYLNLSDHEKSQSHTNFTRNGANFLSLDSLISAGADVEAFLKLNKSGMVCEKKSVRNMMKFHQEIEDKKELEVICNGGSDHTAKHFSPRETYKRSSLERSAKSQLSPALSTDSGHYLRSKGPSVEVSPKDIVRKESLQNGDTPLSLKNYSESPKKINGKVDDSVQNAAKAKNSRSIRWRRPSPESTPQPMDTRPYYKVVGMTTKLRSSGSFQTVQSKDDLSLNRTTCNGEAPLVVKFKRIRRSELSVLSDEAENFMFPKKDDSSETEDEVETSKTITKCESSEVITSESPRSTRVSRLKDIIISDDDTRDSSGSEFTMTPRKGKRRTKKQTHVGQRRPYRKQSGSKSPTSAKRKKTDSKSSSNDEPLVTYTEPRPHSEFKDRCCKWEDGQLKFSSKVENLKFSFERVPENGSWYDAFIGQFQNKLNLKDVSRCFHAYRKQRVLPFQKINLPPLKPGCCKLNEVQRKITEPRSAPIAGPSRIYGTRGMKRKRTKALTSEGRPRKSPREHASTLAIILGGLVNKRKAKYSSDDSKCLLPVPEEDSSNEANFHLKDTLEAKEFSVKETSKKLEEFLSSVYDDVAEYDVPFENVDNDIRIDAKSSKPDILDLVTTYDDCDVLDQTVRELQENAADWKHKHRKGFKMKKKNRTGWPKKKKNSRRDADDRSTVDSHSLDEDNLNVDQQGDVDIEGDEDDASVKLNIYSNERVKSNRVGLGENENSIMSSISDPGGSKGNFADSEDDTRVSSNARPKRWESGDRESSDRASEENSSDEKPLEELQRKSKDNYQPIVRVQKMDDSLSPSRRLRSAASDAPGKHGAPRSRLSPRKLRPSRGYWYR